MREGLTKRSSGTDGQLESALENHANQHEQTPDTALPENSSGGNCIGNEGRGKAAVQCKPQVATTLARCSSEGSSHDTELDRSDCNQCKQQPAAALSHNSREERCQDGNSSEADTNLCKIQPAAYAKGSSDVSCHSGECSKADIDLCGRQPSSAPSGSSSCVCRNAACLQIQDQDASCVEPQAFMDSPAWEYRRAASRQLSRRSSMTVSSRQTLGGESSLLPEVLAFDAFRAKHGTCGGWHSDDHADFERILRTCHGDTAKAQAVAAAELFHISPEEIAAHSRWYAQHAELLAQKKAAIAAWKGQRDAQRRAEAQQQQPRLDPTPEQRRQSQLQRQESKKRVEEWKAAKDREQQEVADADAAQRAAAQGAKAAELAAAHAAQKQQVHAFRAMKAAEQRRAQEAAAMAAEEARAQTQVTPEQREAVQRRTWEHLKRQEELNASRVARQRAQQERLEALHQQAAAALGVKAEADPARILAPTKSFNQRRAAEEPGPVRFEGSSIRNVARKAVPVWRKTK